MYLKFSNSLNFGQCLHVVSSGVEEMNLFQLKVAKGFQDIHI